MRLLIATGVPRSEEAGAAGVALHHAKELEKRGHQVQCWFRDDVLPQPVKPERFEALFFAIATARRILKDPNRFDAVNIHAPWGCVYGIWRKYFRSAGTPPYVLMMHGSEERYVQMMKLEDRKGRAWNFGWKNRLWHRLYHQTMFDFSIKTADYGVVTNREAWICAELKYDRDPGHIWYMPNGAEEKFFMDRAYTDTAVLRLLYVGTWIDRKGVFYLAEAFRQLAEKMPDIVLAVAGCGASPEQVKQSFVPEVRDRVRVIPFISRADMPALYAAHDIFVFPSLVEGMPLTILEAMATGMPVVTTNSSGMCDVVEDGFNGLVVPTADAEELADAVERLCRSAEMRSSLGLNGQQTMRRYTWCRAAQKLERVFMLATRNGKMGSRSSSTSAV
jgi:glycosyltransferase involved in cell wall biosynthesis